MISGLYSKVLIRLLSITLNGFQGSIRNRQRTLVGEESVTIPVISFSASRFTLLPLSTLNKSLQSASAVSFSLEE